MDMMGILELRHVETCHQDMIHHAVHGKFRVRSWRFELEWACTHSLSNSHMPELVYSLKRCSHNSDSAILCRWYLKEFVRLFS